MSGLEWNYLGSCVRLDDEDKEWMVLNDAVQASCLSVV
jgi:hypothetical protein